VAQADRQEKYAAIVADATQKLTEQNAAFTKQREDAVTDYQDKLNQLERQYEEKATAIVSRIVENQTKFESLVGVIGNLGVTSGYLQTANHARWNWWFWQGLTVAALGGLIFLRTTFFSPAYRAPSLGKVLQVEFFFHSMSVYSQHMRGARQISSTRSNHETENCPYCTSIKYSEDYGP
jgi:hypothetical protein